ncbi:probable leucine-rich repeat receptor-like protein kinase At5g49770 isoform X2 [Arabidopsis lyrata subsp. lyrata]|uniref:probable leucine-rich repeat receptor-like protein kinase At5g49770 isoform X2 n=1 Tax=Arabidopsis lyrata subsp. lyrata TaxID=81972 RepID=UPI000A29A50A|nr:probable leucine-rich repeat receptor-like protein kinase At5g49770 isoform X2 [Arabidopsis lyrata subsp. lyrata]|eukprot:XP_020870002.1 probable leucine-rich repeat receptor-like protein kinase At5g49770 isoform X2 [Arabidopsis lyrata subsp. lyrata]
MSSRIGLFQLLIFFFFQICSVYAITDDSDSTALQALKSEWKTLSKSWKSSDPCGSGWVGITCNNNRVVSISLTNRNLNGKLPTEISTLAELQTLDLTGNPELSGPLPANIGNLKKLIVLSLMGCDFNGEIPDSIGNLEQLTRLSLNLNKFTGTIPPSMGRLSKLYWFDIADNQIEGKLPVSDGASLSGLDMLLQTGHFHFSNNKLSGEIPEKLFSSDMTLLHVLFDGNQFTGRIPESLGLVKNLTVLRLDRNRLTGDIPSSLNNLTNLQELHLSDNKFTGSLPNLTSLTSLYTLDVSNNPLALSPVPSWIPFLNSLSTLRMEDIQLDGPVPTSLFSPLQLQTVSLKHNLINTTLDLGTNYSTQLDFVDLRDNFITGYKSAANNHVEVMLADNQVCQDPANQHSEYCSAVQASSTFSTIPKDCGHHCSKGREPNQGCHCVYPLTGVFTLRSPSFSGFSNNSTFIQFGESLTAFFKNGKYPVDSVAMSNISENPTDYHLLIDLTIFPLGDDRFNQTGMDSINSVFTIQAYKPPPRFGPYIFVADQYKTFSVSMSVIIGTVVGVVVLLLLLAMAGIYALRQKRRAEKANDQINPFAKWDTSKNEIDAPQLMGTKAFTFEELSKCTNNFSDANDIGGGGYGQVYKGTLPSGQVIAIKRAQQGSMQGAFEFKTEIELLSRVHHKNVVKLLGFCFDQKEQMLVYEYIPNGSLRDGLSGKNGIKLDWTRRLKIALGSGKGLAYLHELADPPIIHRDVKSNNILLDEDLTAKVADFGLSKLVGDPEKAHVTTQVKGTMGYLDPEYYMTNQLTEKSDVYGFGVVMLELLTGKSPIDRGSYVVKEVKKKMDKSRNLYDLQELLDTTIIANSGNLKGFEKYVDVALRCVEPEGVDRPTMSEVVQEIESVLRLVGLNPNADSATYEEASGDPYGRDSFEYTGIFPAAKP